jgi:putative ABC transport system ATP-binding protein
MIRIDRLSKYFFRDSPEQVVALDAVSIDIADGEFVVVIGSNGSGKSTLLNAIAGSVRPEEGRIFVDDREITDLEEHRRARFIGRVFQNPFSGTAPTMTIAENLRLAGLRGDPKRLSIGLKASERERLRASVAALGMEIEHRLDAPIGLLSGGQRQALTLLMATLHRPRILLLDEHTAALDPRSAEQVMRLTDETIAGHGLATLMVTHDMEQAVRFGSRLVMMHQGRIAFDVSGEGKHAVTAELLLAKFAEMRRSIVP